MFTKTYKVRNFSLEDTMDCGQVFRFNKVGKNEFEGFAKNIFAIISQHGDQIEVKTYTKTNFFEDYLDLNTNYETLLNGFRGDSILERASKFCGGIRILRQGKFESLASFILSSNNNIKRIKGIIERLCALLGDKVEGGFAFPKAEVIAKLKPIELDPIRAGFRAKYLVDAAKKVVDKTVDLDKVDEMNLEEAINYLKRIKGVGDKVAQCVLLFGFHKMDAFPIDVWMKKAIEENYPNGLSSQLMSCPGLAQQLLYHSQRREDKAGTV